MDRRYPEGVVSDSNREEVSRLQGHINAAEYFLGQASRYNFPNPIRTECLQQAAIHASLAQALAAAEANGLLPEEDYL